MQLGSETINSTLNKIEEDTAEGIPQSKIEVDAMNPAPKIFKEDCEIDFGQPCEKVHNFCRGLDPYPGAWTKFTEIKTGKELLVKLFGSEKTGKVISGNELVKENDKLLIPTMDFYNSFSEIQIQGKRKMDTKTFFLGNDVNSFKLTKTV